MRLAIEMDTAESDALRAALEQKNPGQVDAFSKSNIDGTMADTILLIQAASSVIAALSPVIMHYLQRNSIKRIRLGDLEIEHPTPQQVQSLLSVDQG